jgi:NADPH:quinone reductase-like Zn-dependent oxidoreductase
MRAFAVPEFNGTGSVTEIPIPEPGEGQILVRVRAAGVNPMDPFAVSGAMREMVPHRLPVVPGFDYAGEIVAIGPGVETLSVGDDVFGPVGKMVFGEGSWAEFVTVAAALANPTPDGLDAILAAALPTAGGAAMALVDAVDAKEGDTILIVGAAGGAGSFAIQLAARAGARVVAVTRGANADYVRSLGAADVIDTDGDVVAQVRQRYPDGVDAIIDNYHDVDGLRTLAPLVRRGGWIVSPKARGAEDAFADEPISVAVVSANFGRLGELGELAARGEIKVSTEKVPLEDAGRALQAIAAARVRGKLVITVS